MGAHPAPASQGRNSPGPMSARKPIVVRPGTKLHTSANGQSSQSLHGSQRHHGPAPPAKPATEASATAKDPGTMYRGPATPRTPYTVRPQSNSGSHRLSESEPLRGVEPHTHHEQGLRSPELAARPRTPGPETTPREGRAKLNYPTAQSPEAAAPPRPGTPAHTHSHPPRTPSSASGVPHPAETPGPSAAPPAAARTEHTSP